MASRFAVALTVAVVLGAAAAPAAAQGPLSVSIKLPVASRRTVDGPTVTVTNIFADRRSVEMLSSGFVARMTVTVELWRSHPWVGDDLLGHTMWQRVVHYDVIRKTYRYGRIVGDSGVEEGQRATLDSVRTILSAPQQPSLVAPRGGRRLYYTVTVDVETLNTDDLREVRNWLTGDVQPTLHGQQSAGTFLSRTGAWIFSRLMGGDVKHASQSTDKFDS